MDVSKYLQRIQYFGGVESHLETVQKLAVAHLRTVPYENLDNHLGVPTILDIDAFYRKIVGENRGGGCYELNALFGTLLRRLGFEVDFLAGRVFGPGKVGRHFDHLTLRVSIDDLDYMVDVGFGDGFHEPMQLTSGATSEFCGREYYMSEQAGLYKLESHRDSGLDKGLAFTLTPRTLSDFAEMNRFHSLDPNSWRSRDLLVTRETLEGRISLVGNRRTLRRPTGTEKADVVENEYLRTLFNDFGIELTYIPKPKSRRVSMRLRRLQQITKNRAIKALRILTGQVSLGKDTGTEESRRPDR